MVNYFFTIIVYDILYLYLNMIIQYSIKNVLDNLHWHNKLLDKAKKI